MKFNLNIPGKYQDAKEYLEKGFNEGWKMEIKHIHPPRTNRQNRYFHALVGIWALNFGHPFEDAKKEIKRMIGFNFYKDGNEYFVSTAAMDTKEKTDFIEMFRNHSAVHGCYLPSPKEFDENFTEIYNELSKKSVWL